MKIRELLSDETKWIKDVFARTADGVCCGADASQANKWCLDGAIRKCYPPSQREKIHRKFWDRIGNYITWNDNPERTFTEVKALIEELDI